jgi:uncharacterized protein YndB with AHSA1/START domain
MDYRVSVEIDAPPARAWAELTDVERWPEWTASVTRVERLEAGPFGKGSRVRVTQPKLQTMVWTVTEFEPERSFTWTASAPGITSVGGHHLAASGDGRVTVTLAMHQTGALAPIIGMLYGNLTRRYISMEAQGLKRRTERAPAASAA